MRKCPLVSAKNFKLNTTMKGEDKNTWIVKKRIDGVKYWKRNTTIEKKGGAHSSPENNRNRLLKKLVNNISKSEKLNFSNNSNMSFLSVFLKRIIDSESLALGTGYSKDEQERIGIFDKNYIGIDHGNINNPIPVDFKNREQLKEFINLLIEIRGGRKFNKVIVDYCVHSIIFSEITSKKNIGIKMMY